MGLTLVTPAAEAPITAEDAKRQIRVRSNGEDALIEEMIGAAVDSVELHIGRSLAEQTWKLTLDQFSDAICLPRGPVTEVTAVKYLDRDGVEQTLAGSYYTADLTSDPQRIVRNSGYAWPATADRVNAVSITYTAGYASLPPSIRRAMLLMIGEWFANRETGEVRPGDEPRGPIAALLRPYRDMPI